MQISEPAEYAILGLLETNPMHGYEMFQHFQNDVLGQIVHIEMSQLYAFLKKLERLAFIEPSLEQQGVRPPRRIYQLTPSGRAAFQQWLTLPVERPRDIRIFFLIKLYFVQQLYPELLARVIDQEIDTCTHFLSTLVAQRCETSDIKDRAAFNQVILSSRIYQTQAVLDWLHKLQTEFAQTH